MLKKQRKSQDEPISQKEQDMPVRRNSGNELLEFFIGLVLLAVGLFMLSRRVMVHSSFYSWRLGGFSLPSGTVVIPLIIGIIWYFCNTKSIGAKIFMALGAIFIVVTIIMSVSLRFATTSLFDYLLIIGMAAAGAGLLLKTLFKKRN